MRISGVTVEGNGHPEQFDCPHISQLSGADGGLKMSDGSVGLLTLLSL